jgi:hypothetical protein
MAIQLLQGKISTIHLIHITGQAAPAASLTNLEAKLATRQRKPSIT